MFNPWALLFFVVLFCVLFCLFLLSLPSWSLKSFQYLLRLLVLVFFFRVSSARFPSVRRGRILRPFFFLLLLFPFSIRVTLSWNKRKEVDLERLQFCPTFVFFSRILHTIFFHEPIYGLSFFLFLYSLRALVCTKTVLAKKTKWVLNILSFCLFWIWFCMRFFQCF